MLHRDIGERTSFTHTERRIHSMNDRDRMDRDQANRDHWEMFADAMDLTIEGHRLIAQEIGYEVKLLWRGALSWLREVPGMMTRRRTAPPL
jgi:hypothetical protein